MAASILATVLLMCIRESVGNSTSSSSKKGNEEKELLEHMDMDTDTSSDSDPSLK